VPIELQALGSAGSTYVRYFFSPLHTPPARIRDMLNWHSITSTYSPRASLVRFSKPDFVSARHSCTQPQLSPLSHTCFSGYSLLPSLTLLNARRIMQISNANASRQTMNDDKKKGCNKTKTVSQQLTNAVQMPDQMWKRRGKRTRKSRGIAWPRAQALG
jgi:hypothetical protein